MNVHSVGKKCTIDSSYYIDKCLKAVVEELKWERPLSGTHGIKLLHDNAKAHDAQEVNKGTRHHYNAPSTLFSRPIPL